MMRSSWEKLDVGLALPKIMAGVTRVPKETRIIDL